MKLRPVVRRGSLAAAAIALASTVLTACGSGDETTSDGLTKITVSYSEKVADYLPLWAAVEQGYFKKQGLDVELVNLASDKGFPALISGQVDIAAIGGTQIVSGKAAGADVKILGAATPVLPFQLYADVASGADLKGKKVGYTNPRSTSQALATMVLQTAGLKTEDVELVKTGGFGEGVAALDIDLVDCVPIPEPLWSKFEGKYRAIAKASDILPPLANVVGVALESQAASKGEFIKAVIRARRKAVEFMVAHPDEAGDIVAKAYNIEPKVARAAVKNLTTSKTDGISYWGPGTIHLAGLKKTIEVQKMVGAIKGDIDVNAIIDTRFLPDDIKTPQ